MENKTNTPTESVMNTNPEASDEGIVAKAQEIARTVGAVAERAANDVDEYVVNENGIVMTKKEVANTLANRALDVK